VGQDSVRGAAVVHYSGTLDLAASAEAATEPVRTSLLAAARSFSQKSVPFDVYLDDQGRARRVIAHYAFAAAAPQHGQAEITATTDLYEIDRPVTVSTPTGAAPVDVPTTNASPSAKATPKAKSTRR
jgi:hypothetical protein